jgi:hypothetical protein
MSLTSAIGVDAVLCNPDATTEMVKVIDTVLAGSSPPIFAEVNTGALGNEPRAETRPMDKKRCI